MKKVKFIINKKARRNNLYLLSAATMLLLFFSSCKKQLDVKNLNALYYEWVNMYAMINGCHLVLEHLDGVSLTTDKANTIKAWANWWIGYAYAQIGTLYYAGLIEDHSNTVVNKFVNQAAIIAESN